jgi:predicted negative regulator of RcsB-dependent stress response
MQYETEEQQVEALKKWWKKHGQSIVYGVVGGLLIAGGWNYWQNEQANKAQSASVAFDALDAALSQGDTGLAARQARELMTQFEGTPYALSAALTLAKIRADEGEFAQAEEALKGVLSAGHSTEMQWVAGLRLVRLWMQQKQVDLAQTQLDRLTEMARSNEAKATLADLQGDLALMMGQSEQARSAFDQALSLINPEETLANLIRMKRDNLN